MMMMMMTPFESNELIKKLLDALADISDTVDRGPGGETYSATGHSDCVAIAQRAIDLYDES